MLQQIAEIAQQVTGDKALAARCTRLAAEVETAVARYAVAVHPRYGKVYAFETDGFGNHYFMDDANVPGLLSMPYLGIGSPGDPVYRNTRRLVWSRDNPFFFQGTAAEGIGGPHIGYDMIWPMSIVMKAMTAGSDDEIRQCVRMLRDTDGDSGFMQESFHKDNPARYTRHWFAWADTLFGELILRLVDGGKISLLNAL